MSIIAVSICSLIRRNWNGVRRNSVHRSDATVATRSCMWNTCCKRMKARTLISLSRRSCSRSRKGDMIDTPHPTLSLKGRGGKEQHKHLPRFPLPLRERVKVRGSLDDRKELSMNEPSQLHARIRSKGILLGCTIESDSPATAELAAMTGFDVVWIDMEHHGVNLLAAERLFQGAKAGGALTILRAPSAERPHVLGGLERGADMIMVPMVESVETARQMVEFGKYKPLGNRGIVGRPRGVGYGLAAPLANMERANRESHLFVQIEMVEGVKRCREIVAVEGISGAVIGPADLSVSMGKQDRKSISL